MDIDNGFHTGLGRLFIAMAFLLLAVGCGPAAPKVSGTAYYVDCAKGSDANPGTSASQAWQTLDKVNAASFGPGDGLFFRRGTTCSGVLRPHGSGTDGAPVSLGAYGGGARPVIDGGQNETVVEFRNVQYWQVQEIEITGGTLFGLHVTGDAGSGPLTYFRLTDLVVHDVQGGPVPSKVTGLVVISSGGDNSIINDVIVDGVTAYNTNQWGGIVVAGLSGDYQADPPLLSKDFIIRNSTVHDVYGDGIVLWGVQNGVIENSVAYETGTQPSPQTIGTPSSIWTWMCRSCIVQSNESYLSHSPDVDGGSYDIDWGTQDNTYQYNYGHDTESYCISYFGAGGLTSTNAIIRYNVCTYNGLRDASAGAVLFSTWAGGFLDGSQIYNNTIYWNQKGNSPALVNQSSFTGTRPNFFKNNILVSTASWMIFTNDSLKLDYNLYWYPDGEDTIWSYGTGIYKGFSAYQAGSGQDVHSLFADPLLKDLAYHAVGMPKTAFTLLKGSPAIDAGTDLGDMGTRDFWGNPIPYGSAYDIGAYEWH